MIKNRIGWKYVIKFVFSFLFALTIIALFGNNVTRFVKRFAGIRDQQPSQVTLSTGVSIPRKSNMSLSLKNVRVDNFSTSSPNQLNQNTTSSLWKRNRRYNSTRIIKPKYTRGKLGNYTLLLAVLGVYKARWRYTLAQINILKKTCVDSNIELNCIAFTNDKEMQSIIIENVLNNTVALSAPNCTLQFVEGNLPQQVTQIPVGDRVFDFVAIMMSDTNLRPHKDSKKGSAYNNVHIPSFISTMQSMKYDLCSASILNHKLFRFMRPRPDCIARTSYFVPIHLAIYTSKAIMCLQRHVKNHINYRGDMFPYAVSFRMVCNVSIGILDRQHIGKLSRDSNMVVYLFTKSNFA